MTNPPEWLHQFADGVAAQLCGIDVLAPVGCHVFRGPDQWEVTVFVSSTEVVGGRQDGRRRVSRFFLDVQALMRLFDVVRSVVWQAHGMGPEDDVGPHLAIEGDYCGHSVWLRVPALAPHEFPAGRQAHVHQQTWEEVW